MTPAVQPLDGCQFNFNGGAGYRFAPREPNRTPLDHRPAHQHPTPHKMNFIILGSLVGLCAVLLIIEWLGAPWILQLSFKGDIKRESQFLAQYGQSVATPLAALLVWQFDPTHWKYPIVIIVAVCTASASCFFFKRLL